MIHFNYLGLFLFVITFLKLPPGFSHLHFSRHWLRIFRVMYWRTAGPVFGRPLLIKVQFVKVVSRWYITPWRLRLFSSSVSSHCWKGCGQVGILLHCSWSCPLINKFWLQVLFHIRKIMQVFIPRDPKLILLDYWGSPLCYHSEKELISLMLLEAKCLISLFWKQSKVPTIWQ